MASGAATADVTPEVRELMEHFDRCMRRVQTEILRAFRDYFGAIDVQLDKVEARISNIDASTTVRMGELERQMADFKMRLIALEGRC